MTLEELKKKIAKKKKIPTEYRNFESWKIVGFDWDRGILFMVCDISTISDIDMEVGFLRDDSCLNKNIWNFYVIRNPVILGYGIDELEFFAAILDILMDCKDDYEGKND